MSIPQGIFRNNNTKKCLFNFNQKNEYIREI